MTSTTTTTTQMPPLIDFLNTKGINYTACNIHIVGGDKKIQTYKSEKDYPKEINHPWTLYNKDECKKHNKYLKSKNKPVNSVNALPSQSGYIVVDIDSKEELKRIKKFGKFPMDAFHTLSSRKRLPHYYIKLTGNRPIKGWKGKVHNIVDGKLEEREIDLISDNIFENLDTEIHGRFPPEMSIEDLCFCLEIDPDTIQTDLTFEQRREKQQPKKKKVKKVVAGARKKVTVPINAVKGKWKHTDELKDLQNKNKGMELIEFGILYELINALDPHEMKKHDNWFKMVVATANIVKTGTDPYKYLDLINDYCKKHEDIMCPNGFDPKYNEQCFTKAFLEADTRKPLDKCGAGTLWRFLHVQNFDVWKTLAFNKYRPICPQDFSELYLDEALKAFNSNHSIVKGEQHTEVVSWDDATKSYRNMSTGALESNYANLKYREPIYYDDKDVKKIEKDKQLLEDNGINYEEYIDENEDLQTDELIDDGTEPTPAKLIAAYARVKNYIRAEDTPKGKLKGHILKPFIKEWITWVGRSQYERDGFFPKTTPPPNTFNLFQGFQVENIDDYDHIVNEMSKEQLEEHLEFMFQHIKYIMGNDMTEELYDQFMKYMAHLLKYPAVLPRVGWFIHGLQGSGKGQLLNFFENILGSEYVVSTTNANNLFGQFNGMINHKLVVNFNEIDNLNKYIEFVKSLTADKNVWTTKKGKETKRYDNYARVFFFSNNPNKMMIEFSDRRWIVCETEVKQKWTPVDMNGKKVLYPVKLAQQVNSVFIQKCMARYLKEFVEVDKYYNFEANRPLTSSYHNVRSRHTPYFHRFFKFMYETRQFWSDKVNERVFSRRDLYKLFQEFIKYTNETKLEVSSQVFDNDFDKFVLPTGDLTAAYLEGYVDKIFHKKRTDRWKFWVNTKRLDEFIKKYQYDWCAGGFADSTDDEDDEY